MVTANWAGRVLGGVTRLLTRDRDFSLFPELAVEDPFR
jgi:hypothetical protein